MALERGQRPEASSTVCDAGCMTLGKCLISLCLGCLILTMTMMTAPSDGRVGTREHLSEAWHRRSVQTWSAPK